MRNISIISLATFLLISCTNSTLVNTKPTIIVSINPQKYFVERVADTLVRVEVMVPPGSSPETYEPTANQLKLVSNASVLFSLGLLDFELSMLKGIEKQNPNLLVVNHSKRLELLEGSCTGHHHGHVHKHGFDPHVWSSPREVVKMVDEIKQTLTSKFPNHTMAFEANARAFVAELDSLDQFIQNALANTKQRTFYLFHPALTYYARDYNLKQVALEEDGKAPSMKHFKTVLQTARDQGANTIFIQKEFDANTARTAATDMGGKVEVIDPLDKDWLSNMYHITALLQKALNGD